LLQHSGAVLFLVPIIGRFARCLGLDPLIVLGRWHVHGRRAEYFTGLGMCARPAATGKYQATQQGQGGGFHDESPYPEWLSTL
jgi:hypothetical protein